MKHYKFSIIALFAIAVLGTPWIISTYPKSADFVDNIFSYVGNNYTAVFFQEVITVAGLKKKYNDISNNSCLLYTSPSPRDRTRSRMPSSA